MEQYNNLEPFDRIKDCLQDYSIDFLSLGITAKGPAGIDAVRKLFEEGFKVRNMKEYLTENPHMLTEKEQQDEVFIKKSAELEVLVEKVNTIGKLIEKSQLEEILKSAKEIYHY